MQERKFNGNRLRDARFYRGLTIDELAKLIDVSKQSISLYETGKNTPDVENFFKIITALKFPKEYFLQPNLEVATGTAYFRALLTTNKKYRNQQETKAKFLFKIYEILSNYMDFPTLNVPNDIAINDDIESIAENLRKYWKLGNEPIKNIVYILEKNGFIVTYGLTGSDDIDAFNQYAKLNNGDNYIIALSKNKRSAARTQFDGAHELGHIILHPQVEDIEQLTRDEFKRIEKQAHEFAAAFLLPKNSFSADLPEKYRTNLDYYVELKKKWNVSISAMVMRAYHLDLLTFNQYQHLMKKIALKGWKTREPLDNTVKTLEPTVLNSGIDLLLDNDLFTPETFMDELASNYLAMPIEEIEHLLGLEKGKLAPKNQVIPIQIRLKK